MPDVPSVFANPVSIIGWGIFALWFGITVPSVLTLLLRRLPRPAAGALSDATWPTVAVVVPARDEAAKIEPAMRSLLSLDYPQLHVIAVNDRSQDETGAILNRMAEGDSRLRVIHVEQLPSGWLGKNHALHVAAETAQADWLLFTDADVHFDPDALRYSVRYAEQRALDHLCLMPDMIRGSYWENALVAFFGLAFAVGTQPWLVPTRFQHIYAGIGAFNLVRTETYRRAGGHVPIRLDVLDDVKLGKVMKSGGGRSAVLMAGPLVRVKWQESAWGVIRGLEKNGFAATNYSLVNLSIGTGVFITVHIVPYLAVAIIRDMRAAGFAAAILLGHGIYAAISRRFGGRMNVWPLLPIAGTALIFAFWRSAFITLRQQGVRWRDTFYSLDELRRGLYW